MTDFNEESRTENQAVKKPVWKGFLSTVAAGVLGSALTLTAVPYFQNDTPQATVPEKNVQAESSSNLDVTPVSSSSNSLADTIEQASKAIVGVVNMQQQNNNPFSQSSEAAESGTGSGVIFKKTNDAAYIVTNNHVIENASEIQVTLHDGLTDIAVLKISGDVSASVMEFGDSSKLRAGDQVLAIGNPLGLDLSRTVTQGIVSAVDRSIAVSTSAGEWNLNVIQTDAAINPGNSGGALINTAGQLVGINSLKIAENGVEGLGFAIPSNDVQTLINQLIENGKVVRPYLGVGLASFDEVPPKYIQNLPNDVTSGAIVANIDPDSAAAKAGLQVEDILVKIGGKKITNSSDLRKHLYSNFSIGDKVKIEFYRGGELKTAEVTLTSNQKVN
jgi:serine protease Do